ncbi:methyltransferase domain-containing protein [Streptoalloteichus hindustanus]|uniref:Protein-L-isoaspartate O-methyltransferase n=1 Tax=Streptoalloteichus hindustanus TaxID=2017 RepID=A0A1M5MBC6_STRHI|nr:methyltransferase domain-containing protein [Streptoalloteichus hindustanus]SHG74531.1 Protein-L-isoaspartate O-methyltransferase [Streptoalloteichus hindustanus]
MTTTTSDPTAELRAHLVDQLTTGGFLRSAPWRAAFLATPRHLFVPRFTLVGPRGDRADHDTRDPDPATREQALRAAYSNDTLVTRFTGPEPTSSSTEPSLMADMLEALDVHDGHRVLEVGTGTGYNAALLCHRLGDQNVTTLDVDADLVDAARQALADAGYRPAARAGDGAAGCPERAPFDRVLATCGVGRVPTAWIDQLAPGGAILVNVARGIVLLRRNGDEPAVSGRFLGPAGFVRLRRAEEPNPMSAAHALAATRDLTGTGRVVSLPQNLTYTVISGFAALVAPHSQLVLVHDDGAPRAYHWYEAVTGSWLRLDLQPGGEGEAILTEAGPRRLWNEIAPILARWEQEGNPTIDHYGLRVNRDGTHDLWLSRSDWSVRLP